MKKSRHAAKMSKRRQSNNWFWPTIMIIALIVAVGILILQTPNNAAEASVVSQMTGVTLDNTRISLSELRGQVVLLNFWATWCPPCRAEMPTIEAAYETYHDRGFTVLAINASESPEVIQPFVDSVGLKFPVVLDQDASIQRQFLVDSFPTSLFIDSNGTLYASHHGALTEAQLRTTVENGLARLQK